MRGKASDVKDEAVAYDARLQDLWRAIEFCSDHFEEVTNVVRKIEKGEWV